MTLEDTTGCWSVQSPDSSPKHPQEQAHVLTAKTLVEPLGTVTKRGHIAQWLLEMRAFERCLLFDSDGSARGEVWKRKRSKWMWKDSLGGSEDMRVHRGGWTQTQASGEGN